MSDQLRLFAGIELQVCQICHLIHEEHKRNMYARFMRGTRGACHNVKLMFSEDAAPLIQSGPILLYPEILDRNETVLAM